MEKQHEGTFIMHKYQQTPVCADGSGDGSKGGAGGSRLPVAPSALGIPGGHAGIESAEGGAAAGLVEVDTAARRVKRRTGTGRWAQLEPQPRVVLFALRDIQEGEELFLDYGSEYWRGRPTARFAPASESAAAVAPPTAAAAADGDVNSGQGAAVNSKRRRRRSPPPQS